MSYHCEDEVARLIQGMVQWGGDGAAVRSSASIWERILREVRHGSGSVAIVGIDAGYTKQALITIGEKLAQALLVYHTSSLTVVMQAREIVRVSRRTYQYRLTEGHFTFMREYRVERSKSVLAKPAPGWFAGT